VILFNVLDILSQLHEDMLPISLTITNWLQFDYCTRPLCCPFLYDNENKMGFLFHCIVECYKMLCS
jgi:hypothetical protein